MSFFLSFFADVFSFLSLFFFFFFFFLSDELEEEEELLLSLSDPLAIADRCSTLSLADRCSGTVVTLAGVPFACRRRDLNPPSLPPPSPLSLLTPY